MIRQRVIWPWLLLGITACQAIPPIPEVADVQVLDLRDSDRDGVINSREMCAASPPAGRADVNGCMKWQQTLTQQDFVFEFGFDEASISPSQQTMVSHILTAISAHPESEVVIIGDTSPEGRLTYNLALAKRRADAVLALLLANGLEQPGTSEFVWNDPAFANLFGQRLRRTIVRVTSPQVSTIQPQWTIYTTAEEKNTDE